MILECSACQSRYDIGGRPAGSRVRCRCGNITVVPKQPRAAGVLLCPVCGAPSTPDRTRCEHCESVLALVGCPRCLGRVFQGAKHCSHCGAEVDLASSSVSSAESQRLCPRCPGHAPRVLVANVVDDVLLDECHACGGVWLGATAFQRLVRDREKQALLLAHAPPRLSIETPLRAESPTGPLRYLPCTDCGELMLRKNFGQRSGVIIDSCRHHGVWFDRDELSRALHFAMSGGLSESRRRELEELERKLDQRRALLREDAMPVQLQGSVSKRSSIADGVFQVLFDVLASLH